jgi:hypothetical protein
MMRKRLVIFLIMMMFILSHSGVVWAAKAAKPPKPAKAAKKAKAAKAGKATPEAASIVDKAKKDTFAERSRKDIKYTGFEAKRNPFTLPDKLARVLEKPGTLPGEEKEKTIKLPPIDIQGIIWAKNMPQAIVNNAVMKAGDYIGEFEIKEITRTGLILFYKGREFDIKMQNAPKQKKKKTRSTL